ncbi:FAD-dependent oxidoreductase [Mangrovihabitans endophyticus]|uniref:D-amino-acid oxidase n=1 Tax=Mangrovihabitans endophyticus TaxID=1751298 RepID=A0A8J3FP15_9ACTN|nr:FAD-dependent oxidoreductase [Mangrovihabitans endophyticus]GGK88588.1 amino acid oxidase [Mangrovihabitans endophyticus]
MNRRDDDEIVVLGAGVIGLTTAVTLAESGRPVTVRATGQGAHTTSYAAGATWSLYLVEQSDRVRTWGAATLDELRRLASMPGTGVALVDGVEGGERRTAPVVDMPTYLTYLTDRARQAGVVVDIRPADRPDVAPRVVNCTGAGARELVRDDTVTAVRGQVVVVENPGITEFFVDDGDPPVYWFPHGGTVLLGGTAQHDVVDTTPDPDTAAAIVARCARVEPRFAGARVVGHRVGLRPTRPTVRLEAERLGDSLIVHNYGHGGAGVTLSWACAAEAAALL